METRCETMRLKDALEIVLLLAQDCALDENALEVKMQANLLEAAQAQKAAIKMIKAFLGML